ncbi:MAG: Crp/Fnr family transcriptional regulator [Cocleimonas sp.]
MNSLSNQQQIWQQQFPSLYNSGDIHLDKLIASSTLINVTAKQRIIMLGSQCSDYLLVAEGRMRVQFLTKSGREVVLYHLNSGDDCVLTTSCLFADEEFPAEAITETDMTVIAISANVFHETLQVSDTFRRFVFSTFGRRLTHVISRMESLCTTSIEHQLVSVLLTLGKKSPHIVITHQQLASEIGTVREVVSRQLKKLENNTLIELGRGKIELLDIEALGALR